MQPILIVIGTRPEAIKLIPVYHALLCAGFDVKICSTSQHDTLLQSVFDLFKIVPDYDCHVMKPGQDLFHITQTVLEKMKDILESLRPTLVVVQGDTTSAMAAALAAFYQRIPIAHVEAGLRTNDLSSPFPEEMNRRFISLVATYHFAPTAAAASHVLAQGVHRDAVYCTGNTVVDALYIIKEKIAQGEVIISEHVRDAVATAQAKGFKIVILTMHRRESFNGGMQRVFEIVKQALTKYPDLCCIFPYHPNPQVIAAIQAAALHEHARMHLFAAVAYHDMVYLLSESTWVMTDSGGVQEEATSLHKPALILREHTDRMESVWAGLALIVGTNQERVLEGIHRIMQNTLPAQQPDTYHINQKSIYGDGRASEKIARILQQKLNFVPNPEWTHKAHVEAT